MRIGIVALLHESNTFSRKPTGIEQFREDVLLQGEAVRDTFEGTHHEVGGFFDGLNEAGVDAVPLFAARALPSGTLREHDFSELVELLLEAVTEAGPLDGYLAAPHGATVSERHSDADGFWLGRLRALAGSDVPIIGTLDLHANLSPAMVESCNALLAYRSNPHLDQHERGIEAAKLIVRTIRREVRPTMAALFPPLAFRIDRQCTDESPLREMYQAADDQRRQGALLTNSLLPGFPYADVSEMGSTVIAVTDNDSALAAELAAALAQEMWDRRHDLEESLISTEVALDRCAAREGPICLLDMGDNVGGGSSADGTQLLAAIHARHLGPALVCLYDPQSVRHCEHVGPGRSIQLTVGGRTDDLHGDPLPLDVFIVSLHDGRFRESQPRHGGIREFDQGRTAVCTTTSGVTLILTSRRMVPFSLEQIRSCGLDPAQFRLLVAKGVNAPIAAYREVCREFIRVDTNGSTCADMRRLQYRHRRRPLFPFEPETRWTAKSAPVCFGAE